MRQVLGSRAEEGTRVLAFVLAAWFGGLGGCTAITDIDTDALADKTASAGAAGAASEERVQARPLELTPPSFAFCDGVASPEWSAIDKTGMTVPGVDAGFVDIAPVGYSLLYALSGQWEERKSDAAKLFYSFVPAETDPKHAPLFLFFNGGPGSATTSMLRAHGTGPVQINDLTGELEDNPHSWSKLGNLLYVDARQAGFSYSSVANADGVAGSTLPTAFTDSSFNDYLDAADFVRVLLAVYAKYPALEDNPLVVVGESYGGIRAQHILNMLRDPEDLKTGVDGHYVDPALALELRRHQRRVNVRRQEGGLPAWEKGEQFAWQILIQPVIVASLPFALKAIRSMGSGVETMPTGIEARAEELGIDMNEPHASYQLNLSREEQQARAARSLSTLLTPDGFKGLLGVAPERIDGMAAAARKDVSRTSTCDAGGIELSVFGIAVSPADAWVASLGELGTCDAYFVGLSESVRVIGSLFLPNGWQSGALFLKNLRGVHSFITRALLDTAAVSDAIPWYLKTYGPWEHPDNPYGVVQGPGIIAAVDTELSAVKGVARPGHIDVTYLPESKQASGSTRRIRFPTYENSGHMVASASPRELFEDVREFLCAPETP